MGNKWRIYSLFFIFFLVSLTLLSCQLSSESKEIEENFVVATPHSPYAGLVYLAKENNPFTITLIETSSDKEIISLVQEGSADYGIISEFSLMKHSFNSSSVKVLSSIATTEEMQIIARKDKGIHSSNDLQGKLIGVVKGSKGEFFFTSFLLLHGLTKEDIQISYLTESALALSLYQGIIDAGIFSEPQLSEVKNVFKDEAISWPLQESQSSFWLLITSNDDSVVNNSRNSQFLRLLLDAETYTLDYPDKSKDILLPLFVSSEHEESTWNNYDFSLSFPQSLLFILDEEARWYADNVSTLPNYLKIIEPEPLQSLAPNKVGIIQ